MRTKVTEEIIQKVVALRLSQTPPPTYISIANQVGLCDSSVRQILRCAGVVQSRLVKSGGNVCRMRSRF